MPVSSDKIERLTDTFLLNYVIEELITRPNVWIHTVPVQDFQHLLLAIFRSGLK